MLPEIEAHQQAMPPQEPPPHPVSPAQEQQLPSEHCIRVNDESQLAIEKAPHEFSTQVTYCPPNIGKQKKKYPHACIPIPFKNRILEISVCGILRH
jgi:hypothetical protein